VIDPALQGRVKITVIATGFDRVAARVPGASVSQTPVDLNHYTTRSRAPQASIDMTAAGRPFARRPPIDMPSPPRAIAVNGEDHVDFDEPVSEIDTPAFLRRQSE
jgi:hypothetical protein